MSLLQRIEEEYIQSYKQKDTLRLNVLRLVKSALKNHQVELRRPVTEDEAVVIVQKQAKQRQDSIEQFTAANRQDLADKEAAELIILQDYLPEQISLEELTELVSKTVQELEVTNMSGMGKVMAAIMASHTGRVDGKALSSAVKARLTS